MFNLIIACIIQVESAGNPNAVSPRGAVGLMQLTPIGIQEVRDQYPEVRNDVINPFDPDDNVKFGTLLFLYYLDTASGNLFNALRLYNGGFAALEAYQRGRGFSETESYVRKVSMCIANRISN